MSGFYRFENKKKIKKEEVLNKALYLEVGGVLQYLASALLSIVFFVSPCEVRFSLCCNRKKERKVPKSKVDYHHN